MTLADVLSLARYIADGAALADSNLTERDLRKARSALVQAACELGIPPPDESKAADPG